MAQGLFGQRPRFVRLAHSGTALLACAGATYSLFAAAAQGGLFADWYIVVPLYVALACFGLYTTVAALRLSETTRHGTAGLVMFDLALLLVAVWALSFTRRVAGGKVDTVGAAALGLWAVLLLGSLIRWRRHAALQR